MSRFTPFYDYLLKVDSVQRVFPEDWTIWDRFCIWFLRNIYGARYWHEVAMKQSTEMAPLRKECLRYRKKLDYALRRYCDHIGEPAYSMLWGRINDTPSIELLGQSPENLFAGMSDNAFLEMVQPSGFPETFDKDERETPSD